MGDTTARTLPSASDASPTPSTPQVRAKLAQRKLETQAKKDAAARIAAQKRGKTFQI